MVSRHTSDNKLFTMVIRWLYDVLIHSPQHCAGSEFGNILLMTSHVNLHLACAVTAHKKAITTEAQTSAIRRPISFTMLNAYSSHTPDVSMTKGTKSTPAMMSEYLAILLSSAADAADPASVLLSWMYDCANVLGHVESPQDIDLFSTELMSLCQVAFPHWCTTSVAHASPRCL